MERGLVAVNARPAPWDLVGGATGLIQSSVPSAVFVLTQDVFGLRTGVAAALGVGVAVGITRAVRRQPLRPIIGGFVGLAVSSGIAWRTGSARDYFVPDIWFSLACAGVLTISILIGRPLVGVAWSALNGDSADWRHDRTSRRGYQIATGVFAVMYAIRFGVQHWLYDRQNTGLMFVAKIVVNYPLWGLALCVAVWAVRRADRRSSRVCQPDGSSKIFVAEIDDLEGA